MCVVDVKLNERGQMCVTQSFGTLYDANVYYREIPKQRPAYNVTSVLVSNYSNFIYDSNGIELSYSNYSNGPWNLIGYETRFDNEVSFKTQLLSDGFHKPSEWYTNGPKIPNYHQNARVTGINRTGTPGIAEVYSYDVDMNGWAKNGTRQLGRIHGEFPEILRVDDWEIFAEYDNSKGRFIVTSFYAENYPGKTVDDISKGIAEKQPEILKKSNLCKYMVGNEKMKQQYEDLVEMIDKYNNNGKKR